VVSKSSPEFDPELAQAQFIHATPPPGKKFGSYSTANTADGSMVCFETLSLTLISIL
jgi:hypothetical protein